jgi:hypothetical protein
VPQAAAVAALYARSNSKHSRSHPHRAQTHVHDEWGATVVGVRARTRVVLDVLFRQVVAKDLWGTGGCTASAFGFGRVLARHAHSPPLCCLCHPETSLSTTTCPDNRACLQLSCSSSHRHCRGARSTTVTGTVANRLGFWSRAARGCKGCNFQPPQQCWLEVHNLYTPPWSHSGLGTFRNAPCTARWKQRAFTSHRGLHGGDQ